MKLAAIAALLAVIVLAVVLVFPRGRDCERIKIGGRIEIGDRCK